MGIQKTGSSLETVTRRRLLQVAGVGGVGLALGSLPGLARKDGPAAPADLPTKLTQRFGLKHAFVGAGMGFVALPELVAAVSEAGGLGVLGVAPEPPPVFAERLTQIRALTRKPFGVDFFLATSPTLGPITVDDHINIAAAAKVPLAVFHFGPPTAAWATSLKAAGTAIWVQVPSVEEAQAALAAGADGLVVQGKAAGGHNRSTTPLHDLLREVRHAVGEHVLLLAAGGIATGADVVAALAHGADGVWVGTRLVASTEAYAHPEYKRRITEAGRHDTVITTLFGPEVPCQPYRVLRNPAIDAAIGEENEICALPPTGATIGTTVLFPGTSFEMPGVPMPTFSALPPTPDTTGDFDAMGMPAGKGVKNIHDIKPAARIVAEMMEEARSILAERIQAS
jgi:NAD(P)H-dependent flavin oxidoreductase YrpB (nitropropane dioxygenase family)